MNLHNGVMLITYANSLGRNLSEMQSILSRHFEGAVSGLHILPFYPSSSDRGFSPLSYDRVDPEMGSWEDLAGLSRKYYLMYDFMINHLSSRSEQFRDFVVRKDRSTWWDFFIRYQNFWPEGEPSPADVERIYKRKPRAPYVQVKFADGTTEKVWCTFGDDQIDLDLRSETAWSFIRENLLALAGRGAGIIRLDAFAYTVKKAGGTCFFEEPEIWEVLERVRRILAPSRVEILPEIHEHYTIQLKLAERGFWVYDFALPMLLLHSLYSGETDSLAHWLRICPRRQFTTLDTHDGIGVVDVRGLLSDDRIEQTRDMLYTRGANVKRIYNTEAFQNLDIYQINCTYYSALGNRDEAYLTARAVQMFAPGIPQVYYVGLLAGQNDIELVEATKNGRDINRHSYTTAEIEREVQRPVVQRLLKLLRFRNEFPAFDGDFTVEASGPVLILRRTGRGHKAELTADMQACRCTVRYCGPEGNWRTLDV